MKKKYGALILMLAVLLAAAGCRNREEEAVAAKPVIYLYPEKAEEVSVWLDYDGELTCTYPAYEDGWHVIARPDGTLQNLRDGQEYSYLFWEGTGDARYDMNSGFVVKGEDTAGFLQEKLSELGLTPAEYNEFVSILASENARETLECDYLSDQCLHRAGEASILSRSLTVSSGFLWRTGRWKNRWKCRNPYCRPCREKGSPW